MQNMVLRCCKSQKQIIFFKSIIILFILHKLAIKIVFYSPNASLLWNLTLGRLTYNVDMKWPTKWRL